MDITFRTLPSDRVSEETLGSGGFQDQLARIVFLWNRSIRYTATITIPILLLLLLGMSVAYAQVPRRISFQGALTDAQGKLQPNGDYQVTFVLYASETGGNAVWTSPSKNIAVVNGLFNYIIGSDVGIPSFSSVNLHRPLWLEIRLAGQALPNRFEITSGMYALGSDSSRVAASANNGVPIGTIVAYYAECDTVGLVKTVPDGWMLCNGQNIPTGGEYEQMRTIATAAGHAGRVPDLRGMFLRGANMNRDTVEGDVDWRRRTGGTTSQRIGSSQGDAFQGHWHRFWSFMYPAAGGGSVQTWFKDQVGVTPRQQQDDCVQTEVSNKVNGTPRTTSETRPRNVAINWIIRVR